MTECACTGAWTLRATAPGDDGSGALVWEDLYPLPPLGPKDVLVKLHAWSVSYRELAIASGAYPQISPDRSIVPGSDAAGEVVKLGSDVKGLKKHDRVFPAHHRRSRMFQASGKDIGYEISGLDVPGLLCEYAVLPQCSLIKAPKNLTYEETAGLASSASTAWNALFGYQPITSASSILVQSTGEVFMFAIQFALAAGATVIATTSSTSRARLLGTLGVQYILNDVEDAEWGEAARSLTPGGLGCQHVLVLGGVSNIEQPLKCVARDGVIDVVGLLAGQRGLADAPPWIHPLLSMSGVRDVDVGSVEQCREMVGFIEARDIRPVLDDVCFTLKQLPLAYRRVWAGEHVGKIRIRGVE